MVKTCSACKRELPIAEFTRNRATPSGFECACRVCLNARRHKFREEYPEKYRKYRQLSKAKRTYRDPDWRRTYYKNLPTEKRQLYNLRCRVKRFNLTVADVEEMQRQQDNACAICRAAFREPACIDHCHETGKVRGLLCRACNAGIGQLRDDVELVDNAARYLRQFLLRSGGEITGVL